MEAFVKRFNQLLKENKVTKYKVAKELKCSKQTVCNWAEGMAEPKLTNIKNLAAFFCVSTDYLLGLEDESGGKVNYIQNNYGNNNIINQGGKNEF